MTTGKNKQNQTWGEGSASNLWRPKIPLLISPWAPKVIRGQSSAVHHLAANVDIVAAAAASANSSDDNRLKPREKKLDFLHF